VALLGLRPYTAPDPPAQVEASGRQAVARPLPVVAGPRWNMPMSRRAHAALPAFCLWRRAPLVARLDLLSRDLNDDASAVQRRLVARTSRPPQVADFKVPLADDPRESWLALRVSPHPFCSRCWGRRRAAPPAPRPWLAGVAI